LRAQAGAARDPFLAGGWDLYLLAAAALVLAGYLLGSLSFALLLVRWRTGQDIRTIG